MVSNEVELKELKKEFIKMDVNGDGILSYKEIVVGLKSLGYNDENEINLIFKSMDMNQDNEIQ